MAQELFIELLAFTLRAPARRCLRRQPLDFLSKSSRRLASSKTIPEKHAVSHDTPRPPLPGSTPSKIPLHVGLDRNPENLSAISRIPIPKGERGEKFIPSRLARPLGLPYPPSSGQNSPLDKRSWSERHKEFADREKALERRRVLARSYFRPYYQEWGRLEHFKGKSFVANERLFREDKALYFPNLWGETLSESGDGPDGGRDTTPAFSRKITVVGIQSGRWAEEQVDTFIGKETNPELQEIIASSAGLVQRADINTQTGWAQTMFVKLFKSRIRSLKPQELWDRYFIVKLARDVRKGLTEDVRDAIGFLNSNVGYVYLLDQDCRIRWAGSGHAWDGEVNSLNAGVKRLLAQAQPSK